MKPHSHQIHSLLQLHIVNGMVYVEPKKNLVTLKCLKSFPVLSNSHFLISQKFIPNY